VSIVGDKFLRAGSLESADLMSRIFNGPFQWPELECSTGGSRVRGSSLSCDLLLIADAIRRRHAVREKNFPPLFSIVKSLDEALELGVVKERSKGLVAL
jgi:hypothetical protein